MGFNSNKGKRKHYTQMTSLEKDIVWRKIKKVRNRDWVVTGHTLRRLAEKNINASKRDIISTLYNSRIIEYRIAYNKVERDWDERVILRSNAKVNGRYNLNVVFSLTTMRVITVWLNHTLDNHKTLDWSIYSLDMKII